LREKAWYSEAFGFSSFGAFVNIPVRSAIAEIRRHPSGETGDRIETFIIKGFDRKTVS
jgi:hypothetical protein